MDYRISNEDLDIIQRWMDGERDGDAGNITEPAKRLFRLSDALRNALLADRQALHQQNTRLSRRAARLTERQENAALAGEFHDEGLDSADILRVILLKAGQNSMRITIERAVHILYLIYASRLVSEHTRITIEHPVANVRGPQFWRAFHAVRGKFEYAAAKEASERIAKEDPGLLVHIDNAVKKYGTYPCSENDTIERFLKGSEPYKKAHKDLNGGKWNKEISDADIYAWRKEQNQNI